MRKCVWAAMIVAGVAVLAIGGAYGRKAWEAEWARRHPEAARIARYEKVFDAAWKIVDRRYYDPDFDHARWRRLRDAYRPRVKAQTHVVGLYINVLHNMLHEAGTSHVDVKLPMNTAVKVRRGAAGKAPLADGDVCPDRSQRSDLGFDFTEVRRGPSTRLVVTEVRRGAAAERLGVAPGDMIVNLTTTSPKAGCPQAWVRLLSGSGPPREVTFDLERRVERPSEARADLPSGVRVLRFDAFDTEPGEWLERNLRDPPSRGVILDLRGNSGGKVWVQTKIASYFLAPGADLGASVERHRTTKRATRKYESRYDGPLIVLIGPGSASAAEITAYALRFHGRAHLVGAETAGAVLTSRSYRLPDGGFVQVAVADYLTPDGRHLEGVGVKPDLPVAQTPEAVRAGRDLPLEAAERVLLEKR